MSLSHRALLALIVFSVACSSVAQLLLKSGMARVAAVPARGEPAWVGVLLHALASPFVLAGLALYAFGAVVWLLVLAKADLGFAYPFVGLGFVMTLALARFALGEQVSATRLVGTLLVVAGVVLIAQGKPQ